MAIRASWPSASDEPYEIRVEFDTSDHVKKVAAGDEEFDRFDDLTRRLVGVSKGELVENRGER